MNTRSNRFALWVSGMLVLATASCDKSPQLKSSEPSGNSQAWIETLIARQRQGSATVIEAVEYEVRRAFHVMPEDRPDDGGDEHVLYDEVGNLICEFGGNAGHVTNGACDIKKIIFRKRLFPT